MKKTTLTLAAYATSALFMTSALADQFYVGGSLGVSRNKLTGTSSVTDKSIGGERDPDHAHFVDLDFGHKLHDSKGEEASISATQFGVSILGGYRFDINDTFYVAPELNVRLGLGGMKKSKKLADQLADKDYDFDEDGSMAFGGAAGVSETISYKNDFGVDLVARIGMNLNNDFVSGVYANVGVSAQRIKVKFADNDTQSKEQTSFLFGPKFGLGAEKNIGGNLSMFIEANMFLSMKKDIKSKGSIGSVYNHGNDPATGLPWETIGGNAVDAVEGTLSYNRHLKSMKLVVTPELKIGARYFF